MSEWQKTSWQGLAGNCSYPSDSHFFLSPSASSLHHLPPPIYVTICLAGRCYRWQLTILPTPISFRISLPVSPFYFIFPHHPIASHVLHVPSYPLMSVSMSNCPVMPHAHAVTVKYKRKESVTRNVYGEKVQVGDNNQGWPEEHLMIIKCQLYVQG